MQAGKLYLLFSDSKLVLVSQSLYLCIYWVLCGMSIVLNGDIFKNVYIFVCV